MSQPRWTGPALDDLRELRDYITSEGRPMAARQLAKRIRQRVESLATHPHAGRRVPEMPSSPYREIIEAPYRIVYQILDHRVVVLRVWHGRRDLGRLEPSRG